MNAARNRASAAVADRETEIRNAESAKQAAILKAEGDKQAAELAAEAARIAEQKKGEGEAARIAAMAKVMSDPHARFIAALDVAEQTLPHAKALILPAGDGSVLGSIVAALTGKVDQVNK